MKLLVATEFPPNASGGGPAIVRQMLREWPVNELFWWSCLPEREEPFAQKVAQHFCAAIPRRLLPHRRLTRAKSALLDWFWAPRAAGHLRRTVRSLRPDAIWAIPHNWSILPLIRALPRSRSFHISLHDYVDVHHASQRFGRIRTSRMVELVDRLYVSAKTRDVISQPMAADLMRRTGKNADAIIRFGLEMDQLADLRHADPSPSNKRSIIRIAHAGTILKESVFELFVRALGQLRPKLNVQIEFYGAHTYRMTSWFDKDWMIEHGNLPEAELNLQLQRCDWGLLCMSLDDSDPRYDRFSLPTKFATYLAAGLPVFALAHQETSVAKIMATYNVGFLLHDAGLTVLSQQFSQALGDSKAKNAYRSEIARCAENEFAAPRMRKRLYACFAKCAQQKPAT